MNFDHSSTVRVASAVMLASSVCLTASRVSASIGPYAPNAKGVAFYTKGSTGISAVSLGSGGFTLQVPANNLTNFIGYAGINLPALGSGLAQFGNPSGSFPLETFLGFAINYTGTAKADPGLRLVVQDNSGFMHVSQGIASVTGSGLFEYAGPGAAGGSKWGPVFANPSMSINKAAIMFYGGSTNTITVKNVVISGSGDSWIGFQCSSPTSFCPISGTDAHFNYFFDQLNNCS
jgi:hypothetical protein